MNKRRSEMPQTGLPNIQLCPSCGFPNKNTDARCSYCETALKRRDSLPPLPWAREVLSRLTLRWKIRRGLPKKRKSLGRIATAGVGLALCGVGGFIFTSSVYTKSFSHCILSLFFLLYGIAVLRQLSGKHK